MQLAQQPQNPLQLPEPGAGHVQPAGAYAAEGTYAPGGQNQGQTGVANFTPGQTNVGGSGVWGGNTTGAFGGAGAIPVSGYAELVEIRARGGAGQIALIFFAVLVLAAGGYFAYEYFVNDRNPLAQLFGEELPETPASKRAPKVAKTNEGPALPTLRTSKVPSRYGPYGLLPNPLEGERQASTRTWTAAEEETWRAGLSHRFNYQRYKTVTDVVGMKLAGSESILWDALEERKIWIRMRAAMGLADHGIIISTSVVEKAIGNARPEAVEGFFKRFARFATPGERFVLREAMKIAPPIARVAVLDVLNRLDDKYRNLYFAAATQDSDPRVQKYLAVVAQERGIPASALAEYTALAAGEGSATPSDLTRTNPTDSKGANEETKSGPVDGPESQEATDGWDAYTNEATYGDSEATSEIEYYKPEVMQDAAGAKSQKNPENKPKGNSKP